MKTTRKVLMVGNSFALSCRSCLPAIGAGFLFPISPEAIPLEPEELPDKTRLAKYRAAAGEALREYRN